MLGAMNSEAKFSVPPLLSLLLGLTVLNELFVLVIVLRYSYNRLTLVASAVGAIILLALSIFLWRYNQQTSRQGRHPVVSQASAVGAVLGGLWIVEISINNFIAPPLPARDRIDDSIWAFIALTIFVFASLYAYRLASVRAGMLVGAWSGLVSGVFACWMALALVVFGMHFITHDPLNLAEWAARSKTNQPTTMAAYFAYETFAGAFLHLIVLGLLMGALLGVIGGILGKGSKIIIRWLQQSEQVKM